MGRIGMWDNYDILDPRPESYDKNLRTQQEIAKKNYVKDGFI